MRDVIMAVVAGLLLAFVGATAINRYLAISIGSKELPPWEGLPVADSLPPLSLRMVDLGGVGIEPDTAAWGSSYAHTAGRFGAALRTVPPFVDSTAVPRLYDQFIRYADSMRALGFNAVEFGGFMQLVDFDSVGAGFEVYEPESVYRRRHAATRAFFEPMYRYAERIGMGVYIRTDMVALSGPLEAYFDRESLGVDDPAFWSVYEAGLAELFERFPQVRGLILRIGEAGSVYNTPDSDYRSELWVRRRAEVQRMLRAFLGVAERHDRDIVFRSWTVGVGEIGDLHTNPETYKKVLGPIESPRLVVSTKISMGDFWSHLPVNPTLKTGRHRRLVELQARREFETFNVVPNYVGGLYQGALSSVLEANPRVEGVWVWTQGGGPLHRGPLMIYPFHGTWIWTDANVHAAARLALDPAGDPDRWARDWAVRIGCSPDDADRVAAVLHGSHRTLARGLTVPAFAEKAVRGMGLEVPPVIYAYWDIVDGSSAIGSHIHVAASPDSAAAEDVSETVRAMAARLDGVTTCGGWGPEMRASVAYEAGLLQTLAAHKRFLLAFQSWLDQGGPTDSWRQAADSFAVALASHRANHSLDYPAYNFTIVERSIAQARRIPWLRGAAVVLLLFAIILLIRPGPLAFWTWLVGAGVVLGAGAGPWFPLLVATAGGLLLAGIRWAEPLDGPWARKVMRVRMLPSTLLLALAAWRGPQVAWFLFWTSDAGRFLLVAAFVFALVAHAMLIVRDCNRRRMAGGLLALGSFVALLGAVAAAIGLETVLTTLNEELLVLPGMLSRVLGIVTYLNIPEGLGGDALAGGALLVAVGLLVHPWRRAVRAGG